MSACDLPSEKRARKKKLHARAWNYATKHQKDAAPEWSKEERGTYWWGLFEGYQAGIAVERKSK